jgi:hypothetical protein
MARLLKSHAPQRRQSVSAREQEKTNRRGFARATVSGTGTGACATARAAAPRLGRLRAAEFFSFSSPPLRRSSSPHASVPWSLLLLSSAVQSQPCGAVVCGACPANRALVTCSPSVTCRADKINRQGHQNVNASQIPVNRASPGGACRGGPSAAWTQTVLAQQKTRLSAPSCQAKRQVRGGAETQQVAAPDVRRFRSSGER